MATAVKSLTLLRVSASPGFSSAKLSSSAVSSIHANWKLPRFKGLKSRRWSKVGPLSKGEQTKDHSAAFEDTEKILAELNKLMNEMKQLRLAVHSASEILRTAVNNYYKEIQPSKEAREAKTEPEVESPPPKPPVPGKGNDRKTQSNQEKSTRKTKREDFLARSPTITLNKDSSPLKKRKRGSSASGSGS